MEEKKKVKHTDITPERRMHIFSKEVLTIDDFMELTGLSSDKAREYMLIIKSKSDRLHTAGICHIQDYIDAFSLDIQRFLMPKRERKYEEL